MAGFGTEIANQIPDWVKARAHKRGCKCNDKQKQWDKAGKRWAMRNERTVVNWLMGQRKYLPIGIRNLPKAALREGCRGIYARALARTTK